MRVGPHALQRSGSILVGSALLLDCGLGTCPWDCDGSGDGVVGILDFLAILAQWGQSGTSCHFSGGETVGIGEFLELLANWGNCP